MVEVSSVGKGIFITEGEKRDSPSSGVIVKSMAEFGARWKGGGHSLAWLASF